MKVQGTALAWFGDLFRKYADEMHRFDPKFCDEGEYDDFRKEVEDACIILPVMDGDSIAGFLAVSRKDCHPDCDWYVNHAFVEEPHRHKGLMTKAAYTWIMGSRPATYGYDVIKGTLRTNANSYAERFWKHLFEDVVGKSKRVRPVDIKPVRASEVEEVLNIHAYHVA